MTVEMKKYKLGDIAYITKLAGFEHSKYIQGNCSHEKRSDFIPLFIGRTVKNGYIDENFDWFIPKDISEKLPRSQLRKKCLVLPYVGTLGDMAIFYGDYDAHLGSNIAKIELENNDCYTEEFLYYYLRSPIGQKYLLHDQQGAIQKNITMEAIRNVELPIVELDKQKKFSAILSTLDKRIENLRAQNRILEQTAKTIYDYTFLQCVGRQTTYNKTLNRNIPVDWEVKEFQNICNIKRGASPRPIDDYMDPTNQGMPWVKISDASKDGSPFMLDVKESIIKDGVSKSVTVTPGTLIVSNSASPGIPKFIQLTACVHDGWLVLDKYDESFKYYLFYVILDMRENLLHIASGSVFKNLKTDYLKQLPVLIPDSKTMENFNAKIKPLFEKQLVNAKQIESLTTQRNTLLPLLMTGQVEVG